MGIVSANTFRRIARIVAAAMTLALAACASHAPIHARYVYHPAPGSYFVVPVVSGDSVSSVADRYQVGEEDIVAINNLYNRDAVLTLKSIRVPAYGHLKDARRLEAPLAGARAPRIESRPLTPPPKSVKTARNEDRLPRPVLKPQRPAKKTVAAVEKKSVDSSWWNLFDSAKDTPAVQNFLWPVHGQVVSSFGSAAGGERNDGINILAPRGTPVRAADSGTVTYVGNELKSYGNLILIRHDNGYVTAYAHSDTVNVARGDRVTRGQIIAYAGATGDVTRSQVHFEIRLNTHPVDPAPYLVDTSPAFNSASSRARPPYPG
jgi:murein DD-endopeptidase MepM/ murein hydrolase activator NlpD